MRGYLQTGCLILSILCFFYYLGIVVYSGFHTSISWIWLLGGGLFLFLWRAIMYQRAHPDTALRFVTAALLGLLAAGIVVILVIGSRVIGGMVEKAEQRLDYVIVLGARVKGTSPSRALRRRLDRAVQYAEENPETVFVLSGGQGPDEGISEAECMYRYLTQSGVDEKRLLLEDKSTSTKENLQFSDEMYGLKEKSVGVLSNDFHIYRAVQFAKNQGYRDVFGIPASADPVMQPHNILREICCLLAAKLC